MRCASFILLAVTIGLTACASTSGVNRLAFGEYLRDGYQLSDRELRALQYYVSDDIHLRRIVESGNRSIGRGILLERNARVVDEILIQAGTPGIAVGVGNDWVAVSFEPGSYLYFSSRNDGVHVVGDPGRPGDLYYLWATDWMQGTGVVTSTACPMKLNPRMPMRISRSSAKPWLAPRRVTACSPDENSMTNEVRARQTPPQFHNRATTSAPVQRPSPSCRSRAQPGRLRSRQAPSVDLRDRASPIRARRPS